MINSIYLKCYTLNGNVISTSFNGNVMEAMGYYLGHRFVSHECEETGKETVDRFIRIEVVEADEQFELVWPSVEEFRKWETLSLEPGMGSIIYLGNLFSKYGERVTQAAFSAYFKLLNIK